MLHVNLIPAHRRDTNRCRRLARWWITGACVYSLILGLVCLIIPMRNQLDPHKIEHDLLTAQDQNRQFDSQTKELRRRLAQLAAVRAEARAVSDHPDWSILMTELGSLMGHDTSLQEIRLSPAATPATTKPTGQQYVIELRGSGKSQPAVANLLLHLQETGLFEQVKLVRSSRDPRNAEAAVNFELGCTIGDLP